jgi:phosphatidylserine decarboxylase
VALCCLAFFRDPDRTAPAVPGAVLAPADGRVMRVTEIDDRWVGRAVRVSIFLSPLDVHVNRVPASGRVTRIEYCPGAFHAAYKPASCENERTEVWVDHGGQPVVFRQVVGLLARRVVCRLTPGQQVETGQRFGLMKFGSRMDVFLPVSARLRVQAGDRVRGGETVIAEL